MPARHDESGVPVYPRLPVPSRRRDERERGERSVNRRLIAVVAGLVIAGGAGGWLLRPVIAPDPQIAAANRSAEEAAQAGRAQKDRADALEKSLDAATTGRRDADSKATAAEAAQSALAAKAADETAQRKAAEAVQSKLKGAIDRTAGMVKVEGDEVHVQISERVLFKASDDALTERGKALLGKVAGVLKELPDRGVWVQGHTDELASGGKGAHDAKPPAAKKAGKPGAAPAARFASNWELSAARALAVVHHFQDVGKLDGARLTALAFGPYAPISTADRAANRRVEIVVMPRRTPAK
jgi:chemotaxis protein MotB